MKKILPLLAGVLCVSGVQAQVKIDMKPGLWENTMKLTGQGAEQMQAAYGEQMKQAMDEMKKQLAAMPPEQRKMMEEAMAASGVTFSEDGVAMDGGRISMGKDATVVQNCITQAELDKGQLPESGEDCKTTLTQLDKKRFKSLEVCTGESPSRSEAEIQLHSPTHFSGQGKNTNTIEGKPMEIAFTIEGRWLASDCGDVKPDIQ